MKVPHFMAHSVLRKDCPMMKATCTDTTKGHVTCGSCTCFLQVGIGFSDARVAASHDRSYLSVGLSKAARPSQGLLVMQGAFCCSADDHVHSKEVMALARKLTAVAKLWPTDRVSRGCTSDGRSHAMGPQLLHESHELLRLSLVSNTSAVVNI